MMRRSLKWTMLGQGAYFILQFAGSVAVARLLTPYDTGVFAIAMAVVGLVSIFQALGLNNLIVREAELTPDFVATAFTVNALISVLLAVGIAATGFLGAALFDEPGVQSVLLVLAIVPIVGQLSFLPGAMLEREGSFKTIAILKVVTSLIGLVLTVGLALLGYRYMSLAYSQVATAVLGNLATCVVARRHVSFRTSLAQWPTVARFGFQIFAISGLFRIYSRASELILGKLLGLTALGLYSRASTNYAMLWDNVHVVVTRVIFVDFAQLVRDGIPLRDRYLQAVAMITSVLWPVLGGVAVLAGPLILGIYGPQWIDAAIPLSLLCIAGMIFVSITMTWEVFVVCHETARQARFEFLRVIVSLTLFTLGCLHSIEAAAASRIGDALFAQFLYRPHLERMTQTTRWEFFAIYARSGAATLAAVGPVLAVLAANGFSPEAPIGPLAAAVLAGVLAWLFTLRALQQPLFDEIRAVLNMRRKVEA